MFTKRQQELLAEIEEIRDNYKNGQENKEDNLTVLLGGGISDSNSEAMQKL